MNTSNITPIILFPAPELFIENQFISPVEAYANEIIITRKQKDKERKFRLVDSCGETWQFEDYIWKNPVDVFSDRVDFYFNCNTEPAPHAVKGKILIIFLL